MFIPLAEETGLIMDIGHWVLEEACRQLKDWHDRYPDHPNLTVSVNLSAKQFAREDLAGHIIEALGRHGLEPAHLNVELTESALIENSQTAVDILTGLGGQGIGIHMDDFGTGYSSLSYLHSLPIRAIKIDRSFVSAMGLDGQHANTIQAIQTLAANRGMKVIAEGIETLDQLVQLQALACDNGQGYYLAKPAPADVAETLITADHRWLRSA